MADKFDVSQDKGVMAFNGFMGSRSYVEGYQFSAKDSEMFAKFSGAPDQKKAPHVWRWYVHIAAINGVRGLSVGAAAAPAAAPAKADNKKADKKKDKKEDKKKEAPKKKEEDDDDFDVFGDDDEEEESAPKETREQMIERLKAEANARLAKKEASQRTLVAIEIKPWETEQDLMDLWKRITKGEVEGTCPQGVKWGEVCHLVEVAFGIKKIVTNFTMGSTNSADDVIEAIQALEDEVQSVEMTSMNVL
jgi:elongation factor 1-beta